MQNPSQALPEGVVLKSRYRVVRILGQGGFGITYLADDMQLGIKVTVKELFLAGSSVRRSDQTVASVALEGIPFQEFVTRFIKEARQIAQFNHPNIVRVFEYFAENGTAYFVMEYVSGMSLQELVKTNGPLQGQEAIGVINSLLSAVAELHKRDVIHRDIKPANVMISDEWRVVLIDFGTARSFEDGRTVSTVAMVSSGYSPWEQYGESGQLTRQSDIYAIGASMYYLLTGHKPLAAPDRMGGEMQLPKEINPNISETISRAVMKAMAFKPQERFASVDEFRQSLQSEKPEPIIVESKEKKYKRESVFNGYGRIGRLEYFVRNLVLLLIAGIIIALMTAIWTSYI